MSVYDRLGVRRYINAYGTVTRYGGSRMDPEVVTAMAEASTAFVDLDEFHRKAGEHIANLLGVESALVTSGAEAGIAVATAGIMAGTDITRVLALPDARSMKHEALIQKSHRSRYDQAIRVAGATIVDVGSTDLIYPELLEAAITDKTAFLFYLAETEAVRGSLSVEETVAVCRAHDVPVVVDAAAELPPTTSFRRYLDAGADLVIFSGGKDIAGPQSSGLILGRAELIAACRANSCPNHSVGRGMKVDKETLAGLVRAVERYVESDVEAKQERWERTTERLRAALAPLPGVEVVAAFPTEPGIQPAGIRRVFVTPGPHAGFSAEDLLVALKAGEPAVIAGLYRRSVVLNPQCLADGETDVVIGRVTEVVKELA